MNLRHRELFVRIGTVLTNLVLTIVIELRRMSSDIPTRLLLLLFTLLPHGSFLSFPLSEQVSLLLAVNLEMVATAIEALEPHLRCNTSQDTVGNDGDTLAKNIGLLHRVGGQHNSSLSLKSGKDIP